MVIFFNRRSAVRRSSLEDPQKCSRTQPRFYWNLVVILWRRMMTVERWSHTIWNRLYNVWNTVRFGFYYACEFYLFYVTYVLTLNVFFFFSPPLWFQIKLALPVLCVWFHCILSLKERENVYVTGWLFI